MKKIAFLLLLFVSINVKSQDRINREKIFFTGSAKSLENITGWTYDSLTGKWVGNNNVIEKTKYRGTSYSSLKGSPYHQSQYPSFNKITFKSYSDSGVNYFILVTEVFRGYYRYPNIQEDWIVYGSLSAYIFTETEMQKIKNCEDAICYSYILTNTNLESDLLDEIFIHFREIKENPDVIKNKGIRFRISKTEDGNFIRFVPPTCSTKINQNEFKTNYFEIDTITFSEFINIK
jgi:hypothetical protein